MFPINSPLFSSPVWPLDHDTISHDQSFISLEHQISESLLPSQPQDLDHFPQLICNNGGGSGGDNNPTIMKKLNHNASERDRRQKINSLYSSLRSLLPLTDQLKKLSNPATISRVIKYIQELQQEVEGMMKEKEELLKMDGNGNVYGFGEENKSSAILKSSSSFVTANQINQTEIMIQISTTNNNFFSQILTILEDDGLLPLNASSFESLDRRVFCNLHLQVHHSIKLEAESLSKKLLTTLQRKENMIFVDK